MRGALLFQPVILALGYGLLAFGPMLGEIGGFIPFFYLVRRIKFSENSIDYSLMNTTRQALFLPVDRDSKYEGKTAIDTFSAALATSSRRSACSSGSIFGLGHRMILSG